jgi:hypothetical protein
MILSIRTSLRLVSNYDAGLIEVGKFARYFFGGVTPEIKADDTKKLILALGYYVEPDKMSPDETSSDKKRKLDSKAIEELGEIFGGGWIRPEKLSSEQTSRDVPTDTPLSPTAFTK